MSSRGARQRPRSGFLAARGLGSDGARVTRERVRVVEHLECAVSRRLKRVRDAAPLVAVLDQQVASWIRRIVPEQLNDDSAPAPLVELSHHASSIPEVRMRLVNASTRFLYSRLAG